jgi:anion-transporting  ArsA/GET3 family ATPase
VASARLSIFLGKGGVGRTTLASAFAVDRATAGERVLLVSIVDQDNPASRIHHEAAGVDTAGRLELLNLDARKLVDDLVRRVTRLGTIGEYVVRHPGYESLVDIVPGIRELAILHTLARKREEGFDRIVLDPPATGHGIHVLEAPEKSARILAGPLKARALELRDMLHDAAVTDVVIVTLPEEMPVRETLELAMRLRAQGFPLDNVAVNKWWPRVFADEGSRRVLHALTRDERARAAFERAIEGRTAIEVEPWLAALNLVATQRAEAQGYLAELRALPVKLSVVPYIPESSRRLLRVAEAMHAPPEANA